MAFNASAADILARVITSTPVVQQVAVPRRVCNSQQVTTEAPKSGAGAVLGAVAGGAVGNAIGNGNGRALATVIGIVGGAIVGDRVEGSSNQVQNVQQCSTQTFYENRPSHFNVVYEYQGTQYNVQMAQDPGQYVRLQVTPVGAMPAAPQPGFPAQQVQPGQPQTYYQQEPSQPGYVVQQPVYVAPVVVESYSTYYPRPYYPQSYYRPYYGPSFSFGHSRGHGHGHWR
jgi:uncharacterized protein YcfJ